MAHIEDRGQSERLRWRVRWRVGSAHRSKCFARKSDAERFRDHLAVDLSTGVAFDPNSGKVTVGALARQWLDVNAPPSLTEATWSRYESTVRVHILPAFGHAPAGSVRQSEVRAWVADLSRQGLSPSSVRQAAQRLAQILDVAVADERIRRNPARGIRLPRQPVHPRHLYITDAELVQLAYSSVAPEHILVLGYTGMRFGESIGLDIRDLDFDGLRIGIRTSYTQVGSKVVRGDTKTHRSRDVPMPAPLADALREFTRRRTGLVFRSPQGDVIRLANWRQRVWDPALAASGLAYAITPHDLRHTAASIAVDSGANIMAVAAMLGHQDPSVTLREYADLFPAHLDDLTARLSERLAQSLASPARHGLVLLRSKQPPKQEPQAL